MAIGDFDKYECDLYYLLTIKETAKEIAYARTCIAFYDTELKKVAPIPEEFMNKFLKVA